MKIGEYFYTLGLYSQASVQLRFVPMNYPESEHIQRSVDLLVKSYNATGEMDSARFYLSLFKTKYSFLDIDRYNINGVGERKKVSQKILVKEPVVRPVSGSGMACRRDLSRYHKRYRLRLHWVGRCLCLGVPGPHPQAWSYRSFPPANDQM